MKFCLLALLFPLFSMAAELKVGDMAPSFEAKNQEGKSFDLKTRAGHWTVLYFYPKAETPGCTKQACTLRDHIVKIRAQDAEVYGISADTVAEQAAFHKHHNLSFSLLADPEDKVIQLYGTKMDGKNLSKRWTFIVGPDLKIAKIAKNVDPIIDSEKLADDIAALKKAK